PRCSERAFRPCRSIRRPGVARPRASSAVSPSHSGGRPGRGRSLALARTDFLDELRHDFVYIPYDPEVGQFEDRRLRILVDGDDGPGALHADGVLHRARDAERNINRRLDGLPRLADLERVRLPTGVDDRAAGPNRGAQLGGERIEHLEILRRTQPTPTADADRGILDLGPARLFGFTPQHAGDRLAGLDALGRRPRLRRAGGARRLGRDG